MVTEGRFEFGPSTVREIIFSIEVASSQPPSCVPLIKAATPVTKGAAKEVPLRPVRALSEILFAASIFVPGAKRSTLVEPKLEPKFQSLARAHAHQYPALSRPRR